MLLAVCSPKHGICQENASKEKEERKTKELKEVEETEELRTTILSFVLLQTPLCMVGLCKPFRILIYLWTA